MRILVDVKNLALYSAGIAQWFSPLLAAWVADRRDDRFLLAGPDFDSRFLPNQDNWEHVPVAWPGWLPRPLRHPWYDNLAFPRVTRSLRPDVVFSPYHDVRLAGGATAVITVHDLCLEELAAVYPRRLRAYYLAMLRHNLRRADFVLTVSETSREKIRERHRVPASRLGVVYNACHPDFLAAARDEEAIGAWRARFGTERRLLFYPGGSEFRKNAARLVPAFCGLVEAGEDAVLIVTGERDPRWSAILASLPRALEERVHFVGRLDHRALKQAYFAAGAVVYPSLCEGFGRVCLESMVTCTPLACSDLPVMREVAGDYAHYFDPTDEADMCAKIRRALAAGRGTPVEDVRFSPEAVRARFLQLANGVLSHAHSKGRDAAS